MGAPDVEASGGFWRVLRVETSFNDVSFFENYREVVHRDRQRTRQLRLLGPIKKVTHVHRCHPIRSIRHCRSLFAYMLQHRSRHGCRALKPLRFSSGLKSSGAKT